MTPAVVANAETDASQSALQPAVLYVTSAELFQSQTLNFAR
jgi:hypothetical protein